MQTKFKQYATTQKVDFGGTLKEAVVLITEQSVNYSTQTVDVKVMVCDSQAEADKIAAKKYPFWQIIEDGVHSHAVIVKGSFADYPQGDAMNQGVNDTDAVNIAKSRFK